MKIINIDETDRLKLYTRYGVESTGTLLRSIENKCKELVKEDQSDTVPIVLMRELYIDYLTAKAIKEDCTITGYSNDELSSFYMMANKIIGFEELERICDV